MGEIRLDWTTRNEIGESKWAIGVDYEEWNKKIYPGRIRTCNPLIRSQMPYLLGHRVNEQTHDIRLQPV